MFVKIMILINMIYNLTPGISNLSFLQFPFKLLWKYWHLQVAIYALRAISWIVLEPIHQISQFVINSNLKYEATCWIRLNMSISIEFLTPWGRVMHICIGNLTVIGTDNGLSPGWCQAIIRTNAEILLSEPLETNFNEIVLEIHKFSFKKLYLETIGLSTHPGTGIDGANGRRWKLADFLL